MVAQQMAQDQPLYFSADDFRWHGAARRRRHHAPRNFGARRSLFRPPAQKSILRSDLGGRATFLLPTLQIQLSRQHSFATNPNAFGALNDEADPKLAKAIYSQLVMGKGGVPIYRYDVNNSRSQATLALETDLDTDLSHPRIGSSHGPRLFFEAFVSILQPAIGHPPHSRWLIGKGAWSRLLPVVSPSLRRILSA